MPLLFVLGPLLHDCAMHLTEDGFTSLISADSDKSAVEGFVDESWPILWLNFVAEASRFDGQKLTDLTGDAAPFRARDLDLEDLTARDRLFIGEFLRRHHARLAHEIAIWGVPGPTESPLRLRAVPAYLADLAGVLARSHGIPIRSTLGYLKTNYDLRAFNGVHAVFLMCVLRIADYLQVQQERAPTQLMQVRALRSPVSQGEWKTHHSVRDIRRTHDDPESIYVDALPSDVRTFLKLKRLLSSIQEEIDTGWAVLGEVYGRVDELKPLRLTIRRVRSNLDDVNEFAKRVKYIPREAFFRAAGTELLKHMIYPLYGDRPEMGIRELLQNAVDACRELEDYMAQERSASGPELTNQEGNVVIRLEDKGQHERWLTVSDQGIGMTPDIVCDYFLRIGASFRNSDAWRRQHETDAGTPRVMRSGRFGIGVLASFLLGNEVEVSTRHIKGDEGLAFRAIIDSAYVQLQRVVRPVGTTVRVRLFDRPSVNELFDDPARWDWYRLRSPSVTRIIRRHGKDRRLQQGTLDPSPGQKISVTWRELKHNDYSAIYWSPNTAATLTCNGIGIAEPLAWNETEGSGWDPSSYRVEIDRLDESNLGWIECPSVSVFDPIGNLPLNLQRTSVAGSKLPFHEQLRAAVCRDIIAHLLMQTPARRPKNATEWRKLHNLNYPLYVSNMGLSVIPVVLCANGISLFDPWHLWQLGVSRILIVPPLGPTREDAKSIDLLLGTLGTRNLPDAIALNTASRLVGITGESTYFELLRSAFTIHGTQMFVDTRSFSASAKSNILRRSLKLGRYSALLFRGKIPDGTLDFHFLGKGNFSSKLHGLMEIYVSRMKKEPLPGSAIAQQWREIVGGPIIPYDPNVRAQLYHLEDWQKPGH